MIKLWKKGQVNRREFLQSCGKVMVATAAYEAVSVVLSERLAAAGPADVHSPDEPLDAVLSTGEMETVRYAEADGSYSKSRQEGMGVVDSIRAKVKNKLEPRTPSAICGVRG